MAAIEEEEEFMEMLYSDKMTLSWKFNLKMQFDG